VNLFRLLEPALMETVSTPSLSSVLEKKKAGAEAE
jgi:hypothetical protein